MKPKQRFLAAVRREIPDKVPVAPLIHHRYAHKALGRTDWKAVYEVHRDLGTVHHRGPLYVDLNYEMPEGYSVESQVVEEQGPRKATRQIMHTPKGDLESIVVSGFAPNDPIISKPVQYAVKERSHWDIYRDFHEMRLESITGFALETAREAYETMGEEGVPSIGLGTSLGPIGDVRGMQDMIYDLVDEPDLMESVRRVLFALTEKQVEAFLECPCEVAWYDICWGTGAGLGPEMIRKWVLPEVERVTELVHGKPGKYIGLYTLGRMRELLPMLVDAGVDFIETFEPNEGDISLREAKQTYGDRICVMGNFDCVVLARGSVEEARAEAIRCLDEAMEGGGYVMVTADEVPADAKEENLRAMVEVVEEHGRYG